MNLINTFIHITLESRLDPKFGIFYTKPTPGMQRLAHGPTCLVLLRLFRVTRPFSENDTAFLEWQYISQLTMIFRSIIYTKRRACACVSQSCWLIFCSRFGIFWPKSSLLKKKARLKIAQAAEITCYSKLCILIVKQAVNLKPILSR